MDVLSTMKSTQAALFWHLLMLTAQILLHLSASIRHTHTHTHTHTHRVK